MTVETITLNDVNYTTHPITGDKKNEAVQACFAMLREDYKDCEVINMTTYFNSGFNHITQKQETHPVFGIEVEWV
jgi:hypothetical protein